VEQQLKSLIQNFIKIRQLISRVEYTGLSATLPFLALRKEQVNVILQPARGMLWAEKTGQNGPLVVTVTDLQ
jgi:hypothetical protein